MVYIIECADGSLYTGITTDFNRRMNQHSRRKGSKYVAARLPIKRLVWHSMFRDYTRSQASKIERAFKKKSRGEKISEILRRSTDEQVYAIRDLVEELNYEMLHEGLRRKFTSRIKAILMLYTEDDKVRYPKTYKYLVEDMERRRVKV